MGVSTTHRINLSMWILIYSVSDTYYVWVACGLQPSANGRNIALANNSQHCVHMLMVFEYIIFILVNKIVKTTKTGNRRGWRVS